MAVTCDDLVQLEAPARPGLAHEDGGRRLLRWLIGAATLMMLAVWLVPEGTGTSSPERAEPARTLQDEAARRLDRGRSRLLPLVAPQGMAVARVAFSAQVADLRGFSLTEEPASGVSSSARTPVAYGHLPPPPG